MPTRNVVLTDHQESLIGNLVDSGRYQNASEVLREGLRLLEQRETEDAARVAALRRAVDIGCSDIDDGRFEVLGTREEISVYLDEIETNEMTSIPTRD
jgi:antitoxin ParD1/3/4